MTDGAVGNYKGVMLCNRPYQRASAAVKVASKMQAPRAVPFHAGGSASLNPMLGMNPSIKPRQTRRRKTGPSVTSKHKAWLASFAKERTSLMEDRKEAENKKAARRKKFMAREAEMRRLIKGTSNKPGTAKKPAWAHTEESKAIEDEQLADEELDELIQFTENLDYDKFIDDEQVQSALALAEQTEEFVKAERDALTDESLVHPDSGEPEDDPSVGIVRWKWRLRMIEKVDPVSGERSDDEGAIMRREYLISQGIPVLDIPMDRLSLSRGLEKAGSAVLGLDEDAIKAWNDKFKESEASNNQDMTEISEYKAAKDARKSTQLGNVHSTSSIAAIKRRMDKIITVGVTTDYQEPRINTIVEDRLSYKNHVNQLPYMNRNPAV